MTVKHLIVMVVEDHDFQRRTVARMLRALGAKEVREAGDGIQAIAAMQGAVPVDIVLCDLDMPEMDGIELLRHLGKANPAPAVIIASAKERKLLASVGIMAQANSVRLLGIIEKPVTLAKLETILERHAPRGMETEPISKTVLSFNHGQILHGLQQEQFEAFFQPKVEMATDKVVGAEALARWRHPEHGVVGPYAFIEELEQSGQIETLTFLMLARAAEACRRWRDGGYDLTVSVNLSSKLLADTALADRILQVVDAANLAPRQMIIEVTETSAMTDVASGLENLTRLCMRGFALSIDDYGTGFSSLQQLTRIPFTELKIDRGFITGCAHNPSALAVTEASLSMSRKLAISTVAEGVETQEDWDQLKQMGCDMAQGYFVAKPMDESAFVAFLSRPWRQTTAR